ncbi:MAG: aminoacyl-histidine dipeptidase [Calditrichia bacterium]
MSRDVIENLEPKLVWHYFYEISQIPRCSRNEEKVREYVLNFAKEHGLEYKLDSVGNVAIKKPATPGMENKPGVVIQGHLDMVCEKNAGTEHDFSKDPIKLKVEGEWLTADGTTLGADNGIAIAMALAAMADENLQHGPLEALFTIDEETGLTGATELASDMVDGRILLNIDSEELGALYIGCAGGKDTEGFLPIEWTGTPSGYKAVQLAVTGLKGGHSGLNIHEGRGNAIRLATRVLYNANKSLDFHVYHAEGGSKHNAIPREAFVKLVVKESDLGALKELAATFENIFKGEISDIEPDLKVSVEEIDENPAQVFSKNTQTKMIQMLYALPHGVMEMSRAVPGLVETSTNLAVLTTQEKQISVLTSQRSSVMSARDDIADRVTAIFEAVGAEAHQGGGYPAWTPNPDSPLLKLCKDVYKKLSGKEPEVKAIHAGLECGIIGDKFEGMDMISFGPDIQGAHSPDEKVKIKDVEIIWNFLKEILQSV